MTTLHITNGDVAADSLRAALKRAERNDAVVALRDDLAVGPLRGVDDDPQLRADFWRRVSGDGARDFKREFDAQAEALDALVRDTSHVVVWHGQSTSDQLMLRRVCFYLREMPQRLNEVRLSFADLQLPDDAPQRRADRATSVGMFPAGLLQRHLPDAAPVSVLRIGRLALEWQEVKRADAELRRWRHNAFTSGTFAELDASILEHTTKGWQPAARVAAHIMAADNGLLVTDSVVLWRLRELAATGQLELRGTPGEWASLEVNIARAAFSPA